MNDLAGIYYVQKDYPKAIELYDGALKIDRQDPQALRGAALAYVAVRQYPKSRDMLRQLLTANSRDAEALLDLGDVMFMMGDRDEARHELGTGRPRRMRRQRRSSVKPSSDCSYTDPRDRRTGRRWYRRSTRTLGI